MKSELSTAQLRALIDAATRMLDRSYSPYSHFTVGAALLAADGSVYTGCNIENAAFTPTCCAERTAFFKAVSEGARDFTAIAIVGGKNGRALSYCPPCGVCRQVMMEWCDPATFQIITAINSGEYRVRLLQDYLPDGFGPTFL